MQNDISFLDELNDSQRQAVEYCNGASLVIAGAGSGKTRVLTYKVAYLLHLGYKPWNILALTFTNKAAKEMKSRIAKMVGEKEAAYLNMGTFHSIFARILRSEAQLLGYGSNYTIYDDSDTNALIKNIIKELKLDDTKYKPSTVRNIISLAKNRLITAEQYANDPDARDRDNNENRPLLHEVYTQYALRCRQANAMDFDDLLLNTFLLLNNNEDVRRKYVERFEYVLVDEYQDTNFAQQQIVYLLTKEHQHICVVGDDAQSIYSFRGANIENILGFEKLYDDTRLFKLERNYRSTQKIVMAANSLIRHNQRQIDKDLYSRNDEGQPIVYMPLYSDKEEVVVVSRQIQKIKREENCSYDDFAILYRTNAQSRSFEEQLRKDSIPYRIYGGLSFYQRKEIKDVIAYYRLVVNPNDEEAFKRIINYPKRGIGNTTVDKIIDKARSAGTSLWQAIDDVDTIGVSKGTATKILNFKTLVEGFISEVATADVFTLGKKIITDTGVANDIAMDSTPEGLARKENLDELLNGMKDFVDLRREEGREKEVYLTDFLQEVSLLTDLDSESEADDGRVALMTVHSAKGLEFPTVFVVGMEENIFPSPMASDTSKGVEEERRLFYVAITRAEKYCFITSAQNRMRYGRPEFNPRSRFINDISPSLMVKSNGVVSTSKSINSLEKTNQSRRWMQNSNPVASQFMADAKPRIVAPRKAEKPVDPFSDDFKRLLERHGGRLRKVEKTDSTDSPAINSGSSANGLFVGCRIEHQRFGIGKVTKLEGRGENLKATVEFTNSGTKQLLLKFAKYKIIE